jgi:hypothetical protein
MAALLELRVRCIPIPYADCFSVVACIVKFDVLAEDKTFKPCDK